MGAYVCPHCGTQNELAIRCPDCDVECVALADLPPWRLEGLERDETVAAPSRWPVVASALLGGAGGVAAAGMLGVGAAAVAVLYLVALLLLAVLYLRRVTPETGQSLPTEYVSAWSIVALVAVLVAPVLVPGGLWFARNAGAAVVGTALGAVLAGAIGGWLSQRRTQDVDARRLDEHPLSTIEAVQDGTVRVRGRVRVVRSTVRPDGVRCAASEASARAGLSRSVRSRGGVFVIEDGSGGSARVEGRWVRVVGEAVGERTLQEGDDVEVVGFGSWGVDSGDETQALRGPSRRLLTISGTAETPIVLRRLGRTVARPSGVRVAVEVAPAEVDAVVSAPTGSTHSAPAKSSRP